MKAGHNVMFVTFELSTLKTAMRLAAALAGIELSDFTKPNVGDLPPSELDNLRAKQATVRNRVQKASTTCGSLVIYELPPAECSIDDIYGIIENNKKLHGWVPKVVVLDYLELMLSRHGYNNDRGDYARQQNVAMEMRGLANNENVFVYTATQTNRGAITENQQEHIDVNKIAESFGKAMPVDYVVSLNQTQDEYKRGLEPPKKGEKQAPSVIRLWIAKNRNGPKFVSVTTNVFYGRMQILEIE
jgi:replicative DNA helicase